MIALVFEVDFTLLKSAKFKLNKFVNYW